MPEPDCYGDGNVKPENGKHEGIKYFLRKDTIPHVGNIHHHEGQLLQVMHGQDVI